MLPATKRVIYWPSGAWCAEQHKPRNSGADAEVLVVPADATEEYVNNAVDGALGLKKLEK